jgi:alkanesulfonate monooxygenase SsuD/methylene tetrahydromethanopterin reductase-like flavin-dependent oxidoreductase (luciferase family)
MALYSGEVGLQFTTHIANHYIRSRSGSNSQNWPINTTLINSGSTTIWAIETFFVILTAIASRVPIKLGTVILVPYFRNPVDTADAFAALSELVDGREISVGIARGDYAQAGNQINLVKPIGMVKETVHCIKSLFEGKTICYRDYPVLSSFYQLKKRLTHAPSLHAKSAGAVL